MAITLTFDRSKSIFEISKIERSKLTKKTNSPESDAILIRDHLTIPSMIAGIFRGYS